MLKALLAAASALLASTGQSDDQQLIALDRQIQQALVTNDTAFLSRTLADDFRFTHGNGGVQDKADVIRMAGRTPRYYLRREVLNPVAEVHGNIALVLGSLDVASGPSPKEPTRDPVCYVLSYVHLFAKRAGRWQLLSHQTTQMTKAPAPCKQRR